MTSTEHALDTTNFQNRSAARAALAAALILGIAGESLLTNTGPTGAAWTLWIALLAATAVLIVRQAGFAWQRETAIAAAVAVAAALIPALRASDALHALSLLVLVTAASVPLLQARAFRFGATPVMPQLLGLPTVALHAAAGAIPLVLEDLGASAVAVRRARPRFVTTARGALLAVPPLVVFGALFVSADPLFEHYVQNIMRFLANDLAGRVIVALLFAWIAAGLLRGLLPRRSPLAALPRVPAVPATEINVALGAVATLFTVFVVFQARWLFDGAAAVEAVTGLTIADYARRGFFELVAAAALTLPMLLVADTVARNASPAARRLLRLLSGALVVLVLVIMASAVERMGLYTARFGLTEDRLYATAFIGWLGVVFAWFVVTTLRGRRRRFAAGPIAAGILATFALAALNPDALIARVNLERARDGAPLDAAYLSNLSADAAPVLLRHLDAIPASSRCGVARRLLSYDQDRASDWRAANRSMLHAQALVARNITRVERMAAEECPANS